MKKLKLLFWGSPEVAVPFLELCAREHEMLGVVTQPDKPSGRGLVPKPTSVKEAAQRLQVERIWDPEKPVQILPQLEECAVDVSVVVAYGKILKPDVLSTARLGFLNVHFSLLPKYRGASPIQWSLIEGETETGVTLFWLDAGMDTGPVQAVSKIDVTSEEDAASLTERLIVAGVPCLRQALQDIAGGKLQRRPQEGAVSIAPKLSRKEGRLDFQKSSVEFHNRVRGLCMGPKAFLEGREGSVAILKTQVDSDTALAEYPPGTVVRVERNRGVLVQCRQGRVWIILVQPEGKRKTPAADFANGLRLKVGDFFNIK